MVCSLVFAQVKVGSDGKVAIGTDTAAPLSILSVNSKGEADSDIIIESTNSMALTAIHNPTEVVEGDLVCSVQQAIIHQVTTMVF